jgi:predicted transcriptional regulator
MVEKMRSGSIKFLNLLIILIISLNLSNLYIKADLNPDQNNSRQRILTIYDSDNYDLVLNLFSDRMKINSTKLNLTLVSIENDSEILNLTNNHSLDQAFDEFWIILERVTEQTLFPSLLENLLSYSKPTLIWTSKIKLFDASILNQLGFETCQNDANSFDGTSLKIDYSDKTNLSTLLNQDLPEINVLSGNIEIADCQLKLENYKIISLTQVNSDIINPIPIIFQPNYKSNILISSFKYKSDNQETSQTEQITSTTASTSDSESTEIMKYLKVTKNNALDLINLISSLSYSLKLEWNSVPNFSSIFNVQNTSTSISNPPGNDIFRILQSGIQIPYIDPQIVSGVAFGSIAIGIISLILYIIKRYWIVLLGILFGFLAVFKVPTRKISVMDVYHNETRQNIIDILNFKKGQGETVRNLARELQTPLPTLLWHLQILEEFELVVKEKVKREIVIIAMDYIEEFDLDLKIFEMTFKSDKAKIFFDYLLNLQENEIFTVKSVVDHTSWSGRTVIRYISKLLELEIIKPTSNGIRGYQITTKHYYKLKDMN